MTRADVWCVTPSASAGWAPVTAMANLVGRMWATTPQFVHPRAPYGNLRKVASLLPRRYHGERALLLVAAQPGDLLALARPDVLSGRYGTVAAWVIDSFWDERIPRFARDRNSIDHLWITDAELTDHYRQVTGIDCAWLPWGTDALSAVRQSAPTKDLDVLRLGRQPQAWDDDAANAADLDRIGLSYQGRFPMSPDGATAEAEVIDRLQRAKVVLASGSLASPSDYAHPSRDYISARFTDALACGTRIAGSRPHGSAADLFPDEAWVDLDVTSRDASLAPLAAAVAEFDPNRANALRAAALSRFDWRHRIAAISDALGIESTRLLDELREVDRWTGRLLA